MLRLFPRNLFRNLTMAPGLKTAAPMGCSLHQNLQHRYFSVDKDVSSKQDTEGSNADFGSVNKIDTENSSDAVILGEIDSMVKDNKVVLFMKGTPEMPNCGYSRFVSQVLKFYKVEEYKHVDILRDESIRRQVKQYSEWPTFPQLYVKGELVGGSDIVSEMHKDGSLKSLFESI